MQKNNSNTISKLQKNILSFEKNLNKIFEIEYSDYKKHLNKIFAGRVSAEKRRMESESQRLKILFRRRISKYLKKPRIIRFLYERPRITFPEPKLVIRVEPTIEGFIKFLENKNKKG